MREHSDFFTKLDDFVKLYTKLGDFEIIDQRWVILTLDISCSFNISTSVKTKTDVKSQNHSSLINGFLNRLVW